jgi:hypothetical protein
MNVRYRVKLSQTERAELACCGLDGMTCARINLGCMNYSTALHLLAPTAAWRVVVELGELMPRCVRRQRTGPFRRKSQQAMSCRAAVFSSGPFLSVEGSDADI